VSDLNEDVRELIQNVAVGFERSRNVSEDLAYRVMLGILDGEVGEVETAVALIAMRMKRESIDEIRGMARAMAQHLKSRSTDDPETALDRLVVMADPFDGYQRHLCFTPFIPAILAACGWPTLIHGVKSAAPKHGLTPHQVLARAGLNPLISKADACDRLRSQGWAYVDQSIYFPALYALRGLRARMVKRTALTTLERTLMPLNLSANTHLVLGYVHKAYPQIYATAAALLGYHSVHLHKGIEGGSMAAINKPFKRYSARLSDVDSINLAESPHTPILNQYSSTDIAVSNVDSAKILNMGVEALRGQPGLARQVLTYSTANILLALSGGVELDACVEKVEACLDNGDAERRFIAGCQ